MDQRQEATPMPQHITREQAKAFASSVLKGDADALGSLKQTMKEVADSVLPRKSSLRLSSARTTNWTFSCRLTALPRP